MRRIVAELQRLLDEGHKLAGESSAHTIGGPRDQPGLTLRRRKQKWAMDCRTVLQFAQLADPAKYFRDTLHAGGGLVGVDDTRLAALESAISQIEGGFIGNIRHLLHADVFDSIIDQAEELLKARHTTPAAVLGRIVIERWIRDEAEQAGIEGHHDKKKKASVLNDALKTEGVFSEPKRAQVQGHLAIGNSAAHGKPEEFTDDDVRHMLEYARANCL